MKIEDGVLQPSLLIQLRGGTAEALRKVNPLPKRREVMCEVDTGRTKVGDGVHSWNDLPYTGGGEGTSQSTSTGMNVTLTAEHITQQCVTLPSDCDTTAMIKVYVQGLLTEQETDWELNESTISWSGLNLESILRVKDKLFIEYFMR